MLFVVTPLHVGGAFLSRLYRMWCAGKDVLAGLALATAREHVWQCVPLLWCLPTVLLYRLWSVGQWAWSCARAWKGCGVRVPDRVCVGVALSNEGVAMYEDLHSGLAVVLAVALAVVLAVVGEAIG